MYVCIIVYTGSPIYLNMNNKKNSVGQLYNKNLHISFKLSNYHIYYTIHRITKPNNLLLYTYIQKIESNYFSALQNHSQMGMDILYMYVCICKKDIIYTFYILYSTPL